LLITSLKKLFFYFIHLKFLKMSGVNKVILLGNLGKDPEVRSLEGGKKVAKFSLATTESYKDRDGNRVENTEWHNVEFWGAVVDIIEKYLKKGNQVYIEGKLRTRSYDDKDGIKRYVTEIVGQQLNLIGSKTQENNNGEATTVQQHAVVESLVNEPLPAALSTNEVDGLPF
jgi:single-strand DNA-binding protein